MLELFPNQYGIHIGGDEAIIKGFGMLENAGMSNI